MYPLIFESLGQFTFMKDLHLIPGFFFFLLIERNPKGIFTFTKKGEK